MRKEIEIMQVLRVPPLGKLVVEVNGQRYESLAEVREENVRHLLLAAIGELMIFAGGYQNLVDAGVAPPLSAPETAAEEKTSLTQQQANFLASLEAERDAVKSGPSPKPRFPILSDVQPKVEPARTPSAGGAKSPGLVQQIDAILQRYVAADPELARRSIHLVQDPNGGLQIEVDGKYYRRPREIEDRKIQLVIKRALKDWESS
ncbi:MAG TPA: hypothetical protein VF177_13675 [Anaerolineae bacterium]